MCFRGAGWEEDAWKGFWQKVSGLEQRGRFLKALRYLDNDVNHRRRPRKRRLTKEADIHKEENIIPAGRNPTGESANIYYAGHA